MVMIFLNMIGQGSFVCRKDYGMDPHLPTAEDCIEEDPVIMTVSIFPRGVALSSLPHILHSELELTHSSITWQVMYEHTFFHASHPLLLIVMETWLSALTVFLAVVAMASHPCLHWLKADLNCHWTQ